MYSCYSCVFSDSEWDINDWMSVKSPRWEDRGKWIQEIDHIHNWVPDDVEQTSLMNSEASRTYSSMLYRESVTDFSVGVEMSFDDRMAPLIVFSRHPPRDSKGYLVYRDHVEVVLFDEGINIWSHFWSISAGPSWKKIAFFPLKIPPKQRHLLEVDRSKKDLIFIKFDGQSFEVSVKLPPHLHVGITGCEGINRFYKFSLFSS